MNPVAHHRSLQLWLLTGLTIVVAGFFALMNLVEWYTVGVQGKTEGYPFGGEGPVPDYYSSAERYSTTMLGWSIPFLLLLMGGVWPFARRKEVAALTCLGLTALAWVFMWFHGISD